MAADKLNIISDGWDDGFDENDTILSFNAEEFLDEVEDDDEEEDVSEEEDDDDDDISLEPYEGTYRHTKRVKTMTADENSFKMKVLNVLQKSCAVVGEFAVYGKLDRTPLIVISLKNGTSSGIPNYIKFPLQEHEVDNIIKLFEQSPYGKGTRTIVDTSVRNSFQLSPDGFEILNSDWDEFIQIVVVPRIKQEMTLECSFVASLHKLLLYTSGSFFKPHRDSEKENNMFGTLVIQLPSKYKGGQLVVRHDGKTKISDFSSNESVNCSFSTFFSAFHCDCEHQILPITEGYRMCLIYNLIAIDTSIPSAPRNHALEMELVALLQNWEGSRKLVYALTHKYSQSNLSMKSLKTSDKIIATILKSASKSCDLNLYLALLEKDCSGNGNGCEDEYNCRECASDFDEDDSDNDVFYELSELISVVDSEKMSLSKLDVHFAKEVVPDDCFNNQKPYKQDCEHTGNEGVQISKSYRCAAITFWPKKYTFKILTSRNASQSLIGGLFLKEAENYFKIDRNAETKLTIIEWAKCIVAKRHSSSTKENLSNIVNTIIKMDDVELIQNLIRHIVVDVPDTFPSIINECEKYGWHRFTTAITDMFKVLSLKNVIKNLTLLLANGNFDEGKKKLFYGLLHATFDKHVLNSFLYSQEYLPKQEYKEVLDPFINAAMQLNDLQLLQKIVNCIFPIYSDTIPLLVTMCEKHGWEPFATAISDKFKKFTKWEIIPNLTLLILNGALNESKKTMCLNLFNILFDKTGEIAINTFHPYQRVFSEAEILKKRKAEKDVLEPLINAAVLLNDLELMKNCFKRVVPLHTETIPILINQCEIKGWNVFTEEIVQMFAKLSQKDAIEMFSLLTQIGNLKEQKTLCFHLFQRILDKKYTLPSNTLQKLNQQKEEQDTLQSICLVAENIKFNLLSYAKTKSFKDFVPVLLRLVPNGATSFNIFWATIAFHFIAELGKESIKLIEMSWRRAERINACCNDCLTLNTFLESNSESGTFRIGEKRRRHLQQQVNLIEKIAHRTESGGKGQVGVLIVTKTEMSDVEAIRNRDLSKSLLSKLRSVMPYSCFFY